MQHFSCDLCGCKIDDQRYVVNIELFPAFNPDELTSADLDVDHLHAVSQSILEGDDLSLPIEDVNGTGTLQFDLCGECQTRFRRDPLGKSSRSPMHFRATHEILFSRTARGSLLFKGENALSRAQERATCSSEN